MIDLNKAIEIVNQHYPQFIISKVGKITGGWLFGFAGVKGEKVYIPPIFVSKETGNVSSFHPLDHMKEMESYEPVDI